MRVAVLPLLLPDGFEVCPAVLACAFPRWFRVRRVSLPFTLADGLAVRPVVPARPLARSCHSLAHRALSCLLRLRAQVPSGVPPPGGTAYFIIPGFRRLRLSHALWRAVPAAAGGEPAWWTAPRPRRGGRGARNRFFPHFPRRGGRGRGGGGGGRGRGGEREIPPPLAAVDRVLVRHREPLPEDRRDDHRQDRRAEDPLAPQAPVSSGRARHGSPRRRWRHGGGSRGPPRSRPTPHPSPRATTPP